MNWVAANCSKSGNSCEVRALIVKHGQMAYKLNGGRFVRLVIKIWKRGGSAQSLFYTFLTASLLEMSPRVIILIVKYVSVWSEEYNH
jgi:hypothetical protein